MNRENMIATMNHMREMGEENFYMGDFGCGACYCIGGHAAILAGAESDYAGGWTLNGEAVDVSEVAQEWLGLGSVEAAHLFLGHFSPRGLTDITLDEALAAMERMLS